MRHFRVVVLIEMLLWRVDKTERGVFEVGFWVNCELCACVSPLAPTIPTPIDATLPPSPSDPDTRYATTSTSLAPTRRWPPPTLGTLPWELTTYPWDPLSSPRWTLWIIPHPMQALSQSSIPSDVSPPYCAEYSQANLPLCTDHFRPESLDSSKGARITDVAQKGDGSTTFKLDQASTSVSNPPTRPTIRTIHTYIASGRRSAFVHGSSTAGQGL